jgi:hypothetical protein
MNGNFSRPATYLSNIVEETECRMPALKKDRYPKIVSKAVP